MLFMFVRVFLERLQPLETDRLWREANILFHNESLSRRLANTAYQDLYSPFNHRLPTCRDLEAATLTTGTLSGKEKHKIIYSVLRLKKNALGDGMLQ